MAKETTKKTKKVATKPAKVAEKRVAEKKVAKKTVKSVKEAKKAKVEQPAEAKKVLKATKKPRKRSQKDTGSTDFQIKNFSEKIEQLSRHLKVHQHDFDSRRGLLIMVGKRRRLLNYLKKAEPEKYAKVIADLKLKR